MIVMCSEECTLFSAAQGASYNMPQRQLTSLVSQRTIQKQKNAGLVLGSKTEHVPPCRDKNIQIINKVELQIP